MTTKNAEAPGSLKPCFNCGRPPLAAVSFRDNWPEGSVECPHCGIGTPPGLHYAEAWQEWNALAERQNEPVEAACSSSALL